MKKTFSFFAAALLMVSCGKQGPLQVTVTNSLDVDRKGELVEADPSALIVFSSFTIAENLNIIPSETFLGCLP